MQKYLHSQLEEFNENQHNDYYHQWGSIQTYLPESFKIENQTETVVIDEAMVANGLEVTRIQML